MSNTEVSITKITYAGVHDKKGTRRKMRFSLEAWKNVKKVSGVEWGDDYEEIKPKSKKEPTFKERLLEVGGIGPAVANKILVLYPTFEDLKKAVDADEVALAQKEIIAEFVNSQK